MIFSTNILTRNFLLPIFWHITETVTKNVNIDCGFFFRRRLYEDAKVKIIHLTYNERLVYGWRKIMENITRGYGHHE